MLVSINKMWQEKKVFLKKESDQSSPSAQLPWFKPLTSLTCTIVLAS